MTASPISHLLILPVVLPLVSGALMLVLTGAGGRRGARWVPALSVLSTLAGLLVSILLLQADDGTVRAYLLGNWRAPFGIALALDRLSALMLVLTSLVACASLLYALGGDARRGLHFHALFQFQLMGLNGAFLTADLFNLFVFFEVLLSASYGLLLHGGDSGRRARLKASLHYVVFNLAGSALFLVAASLLYGLAGTLNLADLALKLPLLPATDTALVQAAALLLLVVFALKAALLPLYFWLPDTYGAASAPVAALFAIMTKVGVYAVLRLTTGVFGLGPGAVGPAANVALPMLPALGLATVVLAAVGALAARRLRGLVAYLVIGSAGTLLLAAGLGTPDSVAAGLFYLVNSTLAAAAWYLLADRIAASRGGSDSLTPGGLASPWAALGAAFFIAAIAMAGLPPLGGFFGKALLLQAAGALPDPALPTRWVVGGVLASSLLAMVALARAGSALFWERGAVPTGADAPPESPSKPVHGAAIVLLLALIVAAAVGAGPLSAYTTATAAQLFERRAITDAVLGAQPVPPALDVRREMREREDGKGFAK